MREERARPRGFRDFIVALPPVADAASLLARLAEVAPTHDVLRIKGFVEVAGKPMRLLVQGVGARFRIFRPPVARGRGAAQGGSW